MTSLTRVLRFMWEVHDAQADGVERVPLGTALSSPSLAQAFDTNCLRVEAPTALDLDALASAAAEAVPHVPYRRLRIEDEASAERLVAQARSEAGWSVDVELVMVLEGRPPALGPEAAEALRPGTLDDVRALMPAWFGEEGVTGIELEHCLAMTERAHVAKDERYFVADQDDRPAAMCALRRDGSGIAQLEDVYVLPEVRGRGLGAAVVHAATQAAIDEGHELVFIVADDEGWPKTLYGRAGFRAAGRRAMLHHAPA